MCFTCFNGMIKCQLRYICSDNYTLFHNLVFRKKTNKLPVSKTFIRHYWPNILNRAQSTSGMRGGDQYTAWASNPVASKVHSISFPQNLPSKHYLQRTS